MALFNEEDEDQDKDKSIVRFNGASNILRHGIGAVLVSPINSICLLQPDCVLIAQVIWRSMKHVPWGSEQ